MHWAGLDPLDGMIRKSLMGNLVNFPKSVDLNAFSAAPLSTLEYERCKCHRQFHDQYLRSDATPSSGTWRAGPIELPLHVLEKPNPTFGSSSLIPQSPEAAWKQRPIA
jgi:hypothetical protein